MPPQPRWHYKQLETHMVEYIARPILFCRSLFGMVAVYNRLPQDVVDCSSVKLFHIKLIRMAKTHMISRGGIAYQRMFHTPCAWLQMWLQTPIVVVFHIICSMSCSGNRHLNSNGILEFEVSLWNTTLIFWSARWRRGRQSCASELVALRWFVFASVGRMWSVRLVRSFCVAFVLEPLNGPVPISYIFNIIIALNTSYSCSSCDFQARLHCQLILNIDSPYISS